MSTTFDFKDHREDEEMSSAYDMGFGDSDIESFSSDSDGDSTIPKDYWFGRKYFECVFAQDLLRHTPLHEALTDIDSKLEAIMQSYPYSQVLRLLRSQNIQALNLNHLQDDQDPYQALLALAGAIVRVGTREEKVKLMATLREPVVHNRSTNPQKADALSSKPCPDSWSGSKVKASFSNETLSKAELAPYSIALKEHGDKCNVLPEYTVQALSLYPPKFRAIVSFKDYTFEGSARTKKQAKHCAAKEACAYLDVKVIDCEDQ